MRHRIAPGTRIITGMWRGYNAIPRILKRGQPIYRHATVNHSQNFVNPEGPSVHTQNIERLWRSAKRRNKMQSGTHWHHLKGYIDEFIFRRHANINNLCYSMNYLKELLRLCLYFDLCTCNQ